MQKISYKSLREFLLKSGKVSHLDLVKTEKSKTFDAKKLGKSLVASKILTEEELLKILEEYLKIPWIDLLKFPIKESVLSLIPPSLILEHYLLPIDIQNNRLILATNDPLNFSAMDEAKMISGLEVSPVLASSNDIERKVREIYGGIQPENFKQKQSAIYEDSKLLLESDTKQLNTILFGQKSDRVSDVVEGLIWQAYKTNASDIHIEPVSEDKTTTRSHTGLTIRLRIDGILQQIPCLPAITRENLISRIKVMAGLDIAQKRMPQDGRFHLNFDHIELDLRVSTLPSVRGEKIVIRLLYKNNFMFSLNQLGFSAKNLIHYQSLLQKNSGMILVTGPTGCGKTSTLYSSLAYLNHRDNNIVTIEDPVECYMKGMTQVQISEKGGLTFSCGLRAILRQDPDIIMIGEMRDLETAQIGVRAALTGHLVLSTLHTTSAISTLNRLVEMGLRAHLITASITGVVSQRLIRLNCPYCKTNYLPSAEEEDFLLSRFAVTNNSKFSKGSGCDLCNYTGYKGRSSISELLLMDDQISSIFLNTKSLTHLKEEISSLGFSTMLDDALEKIKTGETNIKEVMRVINYK